MSYHLEHTHSVSNRSSETTELQRAITKYSVHHTIPFNVFDCSCFNEVIATARKFPAEPPPKSETVNSNVLLEFNKLVKQIRESLLLASKISLVIDH